MDHMKRKWAGLAALITAVIVCTIIITSDSLHVQSMQSARQVDIPEHAIYGRLFHQAVFLHNKAIEIERQGKPGQALRSILMKEVGLNQQQSDLLTEIALSCQQELRQQDERAQKIVRAFRARYPNREVPPGQKLPPPPQELMVMQRERNNIILRARDSLRQGIGDQAFKKLDEATKSRALVSMQYTSPNISSSK